MNNISSTCRQRRPQNINGDCLSSYPAVARCCFVNSFFNRSISAADLLTEYKRVFRNL